MYENLIRNRSFYESRYSRKVAELEKAKEDNRRRDELLVKQSSVLELLNDIKVYRGSLNVIRTAIEHENNEFQNRRLLFLNDLITDSIAEIFPQLGISAEVKCDFSRKEKTRMLLHDRAGHVFTPKISQGKLMQYLISFAAISGIVRGLNVSNIFIDEAFGAAAVNILEDLGKIIQKNVDAGVQVVLVAQNPALYRDLPRHEIVLETDLESSKVVIVEEKDWERCDFDESGTDNSTTGEDTD